MGLGDALPDDPEVPAPGGPGDVVSFDWHGCAAHLETSNRSAIAQIERFLGLSARYNNRLPANANGSVVSVLSRDRGALVRTSAWQAWASSHDQLIYLILEALGQIFVEAYAGTVFHAAAFDHGDGAVVIHGPAVAGKTTLLYRAWRRGFAVVSDDRIALSADYQAV